MDIVIQIINKIRGGHNALTHRKFKEFVTECGAVNKDLKLHTHVRWLSKGKSLERFFILRKDVLDFLLSQNRSTLKKYTDALQNSTFLQELAFLTDNFSFEPT